MATANIKDRASVEAVYPADQCAQDAGRNALADAAVLYGLRILSEAAPDGSFELAPAKRQVGERDPEGDTAFLAPFPIEASPGSPGAAGPDGPARTEERRAAEYRAFIDRVIATARAITFKSPDGQDPRLKGFHGG